MSSIPKRDLGVVIGRFGPETLGHTMLFDTSLSLCRRTFIIVGSAQERGTLRNPLSVETRIKLIRETYPEEPESRLAIGGLNDMTNELDINVDWGKYLKSNVENRFSKFASLMIYGNDEFRSKWFAPEDLTETDEYIIARSRLPISATMVRGYLTIDDERNWQKCSHELIHYLYKEIREELMAVPVYKEIYDQVRKSRVMDLDTFMKVYKKYEAIDRKKKLAQLKK